MIEMWRRIERSLQGRHEIDRTFSAAPHGRPGSDQSEDGNHGLLKMGYDTPQKGRVVLNLNWKDHLPGKIGKEERNTWIT
jgi:hypothetical protein